MADLRDLYQDVILEHAKAPRNFRVLSEPDHKAEGYNPLCGDRCSVHISMRGDVIDEVAFQGSGCAISRASASMMTQALKGKTLEQADSLFRSFHKMVTGQGSDADKPQLGKLEVFSGISGFPTRVKCATLAWHTVQAALHEEREPVTTE